MHEKKTLFVETFRHNYLYQRFISLVEKKIWGKFSCLFFTKTNFHCLSCPVRHHLIVWEGEMLIQNLRCIKFHKSTLRALQFLTLDPILREILNPLVTALYTVAQNIMTTRVIKPIPLNVYFNTFVPNAPFLYLLKTSENRNLSNSFMTVVPIILKLLHWFKLYSNS